MLEYEISPLTITAAAEGKWAWKLQFGRGSLGTNMLPHTCLYD